MTACSEVGGLVHAFSYYCADISVIPIQQGTIFGGGCGGGSWFSFLAVYIGIVLAQCTFSVAVRNEEAEIEQQHAEWECCDAVLVFGTSPRYRGSSLDGV